MPKLQDFFNFTIVTLGFGFIIIYKVIFTHMIDVRKNWPQYRCNPMYWPYSTNISEDFIYCVQNTQLDMMGYLTQPLQYMFTMLSSIGGNFNISLDQVRRKFSSLTGFISTIVENIFGVMLNVATELQRLTITIKDMMGKIIGIVATLLFLLDGSMKTMKSAWDGPPGQIVKAIGSCFHPETLVELNNGEILCMKDIPLGSELKNGSIVFSVMKIANLYNDKLYKMMDGVNNTPIYVTGEHFIYNKTSEKWIKVKDFEGAELQTKINSEWFSCLITTNREITIGNHLFWDWEDDVIADKYSN